MGLVHRADASADVSDHAGAGPYRPTPTKGTGRPPLGVDGYRPLLTVSRLPLIAMGDVTPADVTSLVATGVVGSPSCER